MKETYRPFSGVIIALKAGILPFILGIVDTLFVQHASADFRDDFAGITKAVVVALLEIIFIYAISIIATRELNNRKKANAEEIGELEALLPAATEQEQKEINKALHKLKTERIQLIPK